ncbi:MAG: carboxypeptidase regulatory-like domain-containing protein [Candidatus Latescibacterota bacterium]|nr:MAG: carboxypeptidase regulatory-like domain-containing protein [Candidatus Latescibacterota bacterium]
MKFAVRVACVAFLTALVGWGCGGGGGDSSDQGGSSAPASSAGGSSSAGASHAASGATATLMGKVNLAGAAPERNPLKMTADPACAQQHEDMPALAQDVIVNDQGMLKNVFVYVKNGLEGHEFDTPEEPVVLDQKGCVYTPHVIGMMVKQDLKILNSDPTLHNIHALPKVSGNKEFNLGMPRQGMEFSKTFENPEVMIRIKCDVHPWMASYVGVLPHPYYAVSGDDGGFRIADLPAGEYTIEAWHERYGTQAQTITVGDSPNVEVSFTFQSTGS